MLHPRIWVGLFILYGAILAEHVMPHRGLHDYISHVIDHTSRTGRFGFSALDELRRSFCHSSLCTSADTTSHFMNLLCVIKCPEMYLPHHTTTESTTLGTTIIPATPTTTSQPGQNTGPASQSTQGTTAETPSTSISAITTTTVIPTTTTTPTTTSTTTTTTTSTTTTASPPPPSPNT